MRVPLSLLKEYLPVDLTPEEIAKRLTLAGLEVEKIERDALAFEGVIVGEVLETSKHPDAEKLCLAKVSDGKETFEVVCGAPNCRKGIKTAFAPIGATLKDESGKPFKIKKSKLRGVESHGMLCALDELGLGDSHEGILELSESTPVGLSLFELYGETVFEIGLTPNLNYCGSVMGVARELAAFLELPFHVPQSKLKESQSPINKEIKISVMDPKGCPRYTCRFIKNVKVGPSPEWLKKRIEQFGMRPVNNVVDVTNFVLHELGHPLHAFDADLIEGRELLIQRGGYESFVGLDGKKRELLPEDLLICDKSKVVALAGVMGGLNSEVNDNTVNIVIESAYFDPPSVRRISKRLGLQTDGSKKFERGADYNQAVPSLDRACSLILELAGGELCSGLIDIKFQEKKPLTISCRLSRVNQLNGLQLSAGEVENLFKRLQFTSKWDGEDTFTVQVPTFRVDISGEIDLVEEVMRLYGYENIPKKEPRYSSSVLPDAPIYSFEKKVSEMLLREGLQEFLCCDLIGPSLLNVVGKEQPDFDTFVKVLNPTSIEQSILRTSLLPGLLQVVKHNIDHQMDQISGFEVGRVHFKEGEQYKEQSVAGIILSGRSGLATWNHKPEEYDFYHLKGIVESLLSELGIENTHYRNLNLPTFHSGRQASIFVNELEIGTIGEIHPAILRRLDVSQRIFFAELDLHDLIQIAKPSKKVKALSSFPGSERDWTITIKQTVAFDEIRNVIKTLKIPLLEESSLIDIYQSEKIGKNYHNLTFRFFYRDPTKTVSQQEVEAAHQKLTTGVLKKLGDQIKQNDIGESV